MEITELVLDDARLRTLPQHLEARGSRLVRAIAYRIEDEATRRVPVDTGFLANSVYTLTSIESGYQKAREEAEEKNPLAVMNEEMDRPKSALGALVAVGAEYGAFVEYGTVHSTAQPYLTPAVEAIRPIWEAGIRKLFHE